LFVARGVAIDFVHPSGSNAGKVKIFNREPDPVDVYLDVTGFYS
jgi:hypothetical protein